MYAFWMDFYLAWIDNRESMYRTYAGMSCKPSSHLGFHAQTPFTDTAEYLSATSTLGTVCTVLESLSAVSMLVTVWNLKLLPAVQTTQWRYKIWHFFIVGCLFVFDKVPSLNEMTCYVQHRTTQLQRKKGETRIRNAWIGSPYARALTMQRDMSCHGIRGTTVLSISFMDQSWTALHLSREYRVSLYSRFCLLFTVFKVAYSCVAVILSCTGMSTRLSSKFLTQFTWEDFHAWFRALEIRQSMSMCIPATNDNRHVSLITDERRPSFFYPKHKSMPPRNAIRLSTTTNFSWWDQKNVPPIAWSGCLWTRKSEKPSGS